MVNQVTTLDGIDGDPVEPRSRIGARLSSSNSVWERPPGGSLPPTEGNGHGEVAEVIDLTDRAGANGDGVAPPVTTTVIFPTLNEAANIAHVLPGLPSWIDEIILVDGGSTDGLAAGVAAVRRGVQQPGCGRLRLRRALAMTPLPPRIIRAAAVTITVAAAVVLLVDAPGPIRVAIVIAYFLTAPGFAALPALSIDTAVGQVAAAVGLSVAALILVSKALL